MSRRLAAGGLALVFAFAGACSRSAEPPTSPTSTEQPQGAANPDGSTLKATAPELRSPVGGGQLKTARPTLVTGTSHGLYVPLTLAYTFELSTPSGTVVHTSPLVQPDGDQVSYQLPSDLALNTRYRWRARAEWNGHPGPWAAYGEFVTTDYRGLVPRPADGQWPTSGPAVVSYVAAAFPERLARTSGVGDRVENMEFLRDRIIEAGRCGGLDVARNLKRGRGPHSIDAIAWRQPDGDVEVVDIASAYDEFRSVLRLHWFIVAGPPGYDPLPDHPGC
jgi:hypothetical protein